MSSWMHQIYWNLISDLQPKGGIFVKILLITLDDMKDKKSGIELTELFMGKAGKTGWDRCFHGIIKRETDADGNPVVIGRIKVGDGFILAQAANQYALGERLDELVLMVLDYGLHDNDDISLMMVGTNFYLN